MDDLFLFLTVSRGTIREHALQEVAVMWLKDAVAGVGLLIFVASSFVLSSAFQAAAAGF
jgi:hypothetical protein